METTTTSALACVATLARWTVDDVLGLAKADRDIIAACETARHAAEEPGVHGLALRDALAEIGHVMTHLDTRPDPRLYRPIWTHPDYRPGTTGQRCVCTLLRRLPGQVRLPRLVYLSGPAAWPSAREITSPAEHPQYAHHDISRWSPEMD